MATVQEKATNSNYDTNVWNIRTEKKIWKKREVLTFIYKFSKLTKI